MEVKQGQMTELLSIKTKQIAEMMESTYGKEIFQNSSVTKQNISKSQSMVVELQSVLPLF